MVMFQFLALAHESRAVKNDQQGTARMHGSSPNRWHLAKRGEGHTAYDEGDPEEEVLINHAAGAARELHQEREPAQIVIHQCNGRTMDRHFTAGSAHGNANITGRQRRSIIDAVTDYRDLVALGLDAAHKFDFVLREAFPFDFLTTDFARHANGNGLAVARDHGDAANPACF